jgi:hypothetical protein
MHLHRSARSWCLLALAFVSVLAAAMALTATVPSVVAQASQSDCHSGQFCMWQNYDYNNEVSGTFWSRTYGTVSNYSWHFVGNANNGNAFNDKATSLYNNRAFDVGVNKDFNPVSGTDRYCYGGGLAISNLVTRNWPDGSAENDSISAYWFSGTSSGCNF